MKKYMIAGMMMIAGTLAAQSVEPVLEAEGKMVKATYFYEDGKIQQQGYFLDGKPEGKWVTFDKAGNKNSIAQYSAGMKTGKWYFFNGNNVNEVDYTDNRVASVKSYSKDALVVRE